ncbi:MAG: helix-turn-helix domain-containing protein, partial [Betaproteobacteria bacterium]|nr:helix-turn-helix domain-containing protein [Betaproteobacteria bacterium]
DCAHSNEFHITHEFLSYMLGVRRAGITESAGMLQKMKLISYSRGHLKVLDHSRLETAACGCYQASKETYKKVLG